MLFHWLSHVMSHYAVHGWCMREFLELFTYFGRFKSNSYSFYPCHESRWLSTISYSTRARDCLLSADWFLIPNPALSRICF